VTIESRNRLALRLLIAAIVIALLSVAVFVIRFDANRYKSELIRLVNSQTGWQLSIDGEVSLEIWPQINLSIGGASISDSEKAALTARFDSGEFRVGLGPLLLGNLAVEGIVLKGLALSPQPGSDWQLDRAEVRLGRVAAGQADRATLKGRLRSETRETDLAIDIQSEYRIGPDAKLLVLDRLQASASGTLAGYAGVRGRLAGKLSVDDHDAQILADRLAIALSIEQGPALSLEGKGRIWTDSEKAELALEGRLDDSPVIVSINAGAFDPLSLRYQLDLYQLDVDSLSRALNASRERVRRPLSSDGKTVAASGHGGSAANPVTAIGAIDANGLIRIGQLRISGMTIERLEATLLTGGGRIRVEPLSARLFGGSIESTLLLDPAGHRLGAALRNIDVGALLRATAGRDALDGRGSLDLDLRAQGDQPDAAIASLGGTASFSLREGAIKGIDLDRLLPRIRAALQGKLALADRPRNDERSSFESLSGSFRIRDGVALSDDTEFRSGWFRSSAAGRVDLPAQSMDWALRATILPVPAAESRTAPDPTDRRETLIRFQGMSIPIRIAGRFDDLSYRVDLSQLAAEFGRREMQREATERLNRERQASEGKELLDRLREMLRR
jgi:AsmA protein